MRTALRTAAALALMFAVVVPQIEARLSNNNRRAAVLEGFYALSSFASSRANLTRL